MSFVSHQARLAISYLKNDYDAFLAAFVYQFLCGGAEIIEAVEKQQYRSPISHPLFTDIPIIGASLVAPARQFITFGTHHCVNRRHVQDGTCVYFENSHSLPQAMFPSMADDPNAAKHRALGLMYDQNTVELGEVFHYHPDYTLTESVLSALEAAGHIDVGSPEFQRLNQFFNFKNPSNGAFWLDELVKEKIFTLYPSLTPSDMVLLNERVKRSDEEPGGFGSWFRAQWRNELSPLRWR